MDINDYPKSWLRWPEAFDETDKEAIKFFADVDSGKRNIKDIDDYMTASAKTTSTFSTSLKSLGANLLSIGVNMGIMLAVTKGIELASKLFVDLSQATEELKEQQEQFAAVRDEVDSLKTELNTAYDRIKELQSLGSLSLVEDEELSKLQSTTAEMERQLAIKKEELRLEAKDTAKKAEKAYDASFRSKYAEDGDYIAGAGVTSNNPTQELENAIKAYYKEKEKYNNAMKNVDLFLSETEKNGGRYTETGKVSYAEYEKYQKQADLYSEQMDRAGKQAKSMYEPINAQKEAYEGLFQVGEELTAQQMEEYAVMKDGSATYENFCTDINNTTKAFSELNAEQKRRSLNNKMTLSGVSDENSKKILDSYSDEELDVLATVNFDSNSTKKSIDEQIKLMDQEASNNPLTPTLSTSDIIDKLNTQLKPTFDSLKSAYQNIFKMEDGKTKFTLENVDLSMLSSVKSELDNISKELKIDIDYTSFDNFARVLSDSSSTADQVQQAFNEVGNTVLSTLNPALSECSGEQYQLIQSMLESLGIMNSEQVMISALGYSYEEYVAAKNEAANAGLDLANATESEINAFVLEAIESGNCGQALALLQLKKLLVNDTPISTASDVQQIMNLASAAGMGAEVLAQLASAKSILSSVESGKAVSLNSYEKAKSDIEAANKTMLNWKPPAIKFNGNAGSKGNKSAGKAGKEAADEYLKAFEEELKKLQELKDRGTITEKQYLDNLRILYQRYFSDRKKYIDEYKKYENQYLQGMKSLYGSALSGITGILNKQIGAYGKQKDAAVNSLNASKKAAEDSYKAQQKALDAQIEGINEQIKSYNRQKKAKQDEIDKIREANTERDLQLDLEKKIYEQNQIMNQRARVYKEGKGLIFEQNTAGILDAKNAVDDAKDEIKISGIQKEINAIENSIDSLNDKIDGLEDQKRKIDDLIDSSNSYYDSLITQTEAYWESLIEGLTNYKTRWEELGELEDNAKLAAQLKELGITTEDILNMSDEAFEAFKANYLSILADIYSGNDNMLSAISQTAGTTTDNLGSYIDATKGFINSLSEVDLSGVADDLTATSEGMDKVASSSETASTNTKNTADSMTALNSATTGLPENLSSISDGLNSIATSSNFDTLKTSLSDLAGIIEEISIALGVSSEDNISGLQSALTALSTISLDDGIVSQFNNLKEAVNSVTAAINGAAGSGGGENTKTSSKSKKGSSEKDNGGGGSSSLTGAIQEHGNISSQVLGEDGSGEIGQFGQLKQAVDDVTASIGGAESSEGNGKEESDSLTNSLQSHYEVANELVPQEQTLFEKLSDVMAQAKEHIISIKDTLEDMDGKTFNVTLKVSGGSNFGDNSFSYSPVTAGAKGGVIETFASGGTVSKRNTYFDDLAKSVGEDTMVAVKEGERILTPVQNDYWEKWTNVIPDLMKNYTSIVDLKTPDYSNMIQPRTQEVKVNQDIKVTLPNVTNEAGFNKFKNELNQMKLDAIQRSYRK